MLRRSRCVRPAGLMMCPVAERVAMNEFPRSASSQEVTGLAVSYLIHQNYASYSEEEHSIWAELVERAFPELEKHAASEYLDGFSIIGLENDRLPNLTEISGRLQPRTGWNATPVSGRSEERRLGEEGRSRG